jgi:CobQ-like glutamine amidotransferase family enzyme
MVDLLLNLAHLYPQQMNLYGDRGNVLALKFRAEHRGIDFHVLDVEPGQSVDWTAIDIVFMGGGEDSHQAKIYEDFRKQGEALVPQLNSGLPMLAVCGAYQLLGHSYRTDEGRELEGLGYLNVRTESGKGRATGNVVCETTLPVLPATLVGFENHGGQTFLGSGAQPLATVQVGHGNNGTDGTEGVVKNHAIGTYLHGSLLPKNPQLTDLLLQWALTRQGFPAEDLPTLASVRELAAHDAVIRREKLKHV